MQQDLLPPTLYADAKRIMEKYKTDIPHCERVFLNAHQIFCLAMPQFEKVEKIQCHPLWQRLALASLLHDIGHYVTDKGHHKHSRYLIENEEEFSHWEESLRQDVAMLSQSHRKHAKNSWLQERFSGDLALFQLTAILRVSDGLDRSHTGRVKIVGGHVDHEKFALDVTGLRKSENEVIMDKKADAWTHAFHQLFVLRILPNP